MLVVSDAFSSGLFTGQLGVLTALVVLAAKDYFFNTWPRRFLAVNFTRLIPFDRERAQLDSLEEALAQLRAGRSVLFIHHAGKGGQQRGTSRREDVLDTVIGLRRPADYAADQGARFEIAIEKGRGIYGDDARPIEARYEERDGVAIWMRTEILDAEVTRVADALNDGLSIREAANKLGIHKSKIERLKKKASERGLLDD